MARRASTATNGERTITDTPARAFGFFLGLASTPEARSVLAKNGYREEDHLEGWNILSKLCRWRAVVTRDESPVRARAELRDWQETGLRVVRATLARSHPQQLEFLLGGLPIKSSAANRSETPILTVGVLLDRADTLSSRGQPGDAAALERLAQRGFDASRREALRGLIKAAQDLAHDDDAPSSRDLSPTADELRDVRTWFVPWSELARSVIRRRDHLIRLGLVRRNPPRKKKPPPATG